MSYDIISRYPGCFQPPTPGETLRCIVKLPSHLRLQTPRDRAPGPCRVLKKTNQILATMGTVTFATNQIFAKHTRMGATIYSCTLLCLGRPGSEGEHPVSAKFRGLRNRFIRWWVLGAPHEQPIFTSVFEKNVIFAGANRVSATFQLRFSCVSAAFQLRFSSLEINFFFERSSFLVPKYPRSSKSNFWSNLCFLCFSCVSAGKNGVLTLWTSTT